MRINNNIFFFVSKNHRAILWYKFLTMTKYVGFMITYPLILFIICMYMEGERGRSYGGKQSQVEQKDEAGDGRGTHNEVDL